jgi:hypothetical protein
VIEENVAPTQVPPTPSPPVYDILCNDLYQE